MLELFALLNISLHGVIVTCAAGEAAADTIQGAQGKVGLT